MKVLLIVNTDGALYVFRKPIIKKLIALGHDVISISSESRYFGLLKELGVKPTALDFSRHSISLTKNIRLFVQLYRLIRQQKPEIVHNFTHKPAIYGTLAARVAGVRRVFITITGLGTLFTNDEAKYRILRSLLLMQYRVALRFAETVFFQNPDDMKYFVSKGIVDARKAVLTYGSGVELDEFPLPSAEDAGRAKAALGHELGLDLKSQKIVLFPARGIREKGFFEFYEAARIITQVEPNRYVFLHLGLVDADASSQISRDGIARLSSECGVCYLGYKDNIQDYMKASDVVALPSYGEGTPRSLIEALALGKVIVTTDAPGCRETVIDGWNGFLCNVGSARSLAARLLAVDDTLIRDAATRSRHYCESRYDAGWLVQLTLDSYLGKAKRGEDDTV